MCVNIYLCPQRCSCKPSGERGDPKTCVLNSIFKQFLFLSESFRFFDGIVQFLHHLFVRLIRWKVQSIEAGVTAWQPGLLADLLNAEPLGTIASCKIKYKRRKLAAVKDHKRSRSFSEKRGQQFVVYTACLLQTSKNKFKLM